MWLASERGRCARGHIAESEVAQAPRQFFWFQTLLSSLYATQES